MKQKFHLISELCTTHYFNQQYLTLSSRTYSMTSDQSFKHTTTLHIQEIKRVLTLSAVMKAYDLARALREDRPMPRPNKSFKQFLDPKLFGDHCQHLISSILGQDPPNVEISCKLVFFVILLIYKQNPVIT